MTVTSSAFEHGDAIPNLYSSYDQNASPPLRWSQGPQGTRSYAILVEDPDARITPLPVVHWVVWNIPAAVIALREGLESLDRLEDPMGLRRDRTRPPAALATRVLVRPKVIRRTTITSRSSPWTRCSIFARVRTAKRLKPWAVMYWPREN